MVEETASDEVIQPDTEIKPIDTEIKPIDNAATDALIARVRSIPGNRRMRVWLLPLALLVAFIIAMIGLGSANLLESGWPVLAAIILTIVTGVAIWTVAEQHDIRHIKALAATKEIRVVGGLLEAVNCGIRRAADLVEQPLVELLQSVKEEHAVLLHTGDREALNALLYGKSGTLSLAALSALEQVGDGTALPYLSSIAAGKGIPTTLRHRKEEVQARAQQTVERIRERIERHNRASVLLRASQIPATSPEQLVRPSDGRAPVKTQELLRPEVSLESEVNLENERLANEPGAKEKLQ